jgi:hypothetical protein
MLDHCRGRSRPAKGWNGDTCKSCINEIVVEEEAKALVNGLRGSPTVLVDGRDIEPDSPIPIGSLG